MNKICAVGWYFGKVCSELVLAVRGRRIPVVIGGSGSGRGYHPWDNLNPCPKCGDKAAWLVGNDGKCYESGSPYKIICTSCGYQSISSDDWAICKADWNKRVEGQ